MRNALILLALTAAAPVAAEDCAGVTGGSADFSSLDTGLSVAAATSTHAALGAPSAVRLSDVLQRQDDERCRSTSNVGDGYVKQTEFDNTPYRFNMKPGQKLSAAEFDAWMESRGIRIVRAKPTEAVPAAAQTVSN